MSNKLLIPMKKCMAIVLALLVLFFTMQAYSYAQAVFNITQVKVTKLSKTPVLTFSRNDKSLQLPLQ